MICRYKFIMTNCEFFRDIILSKYSRICDNYRSFENVKEIK